MVVRSPVTGQTRKETLAGQGLPLSFGLRRAVFYASAVAGSMDERTSEILFAGKPPRSACSLIVSRFGAM